MNIMDRRNDVLRMGFLTAALALIIPAAAAAATIKCAGVLNDAQGKPQDGTFLLHFQLVDPAGRAVFWREASYVRVDAGRFEAILGKKTAITESLLSREYKLTVEAPLGTGWTAKAVAPLTVIGQENPETSAPRTPEIVPAPKLPEPEVSADAQAPKVPEPEVPAAAVRHDPTRTAAVISKPAPVKPREPSGEMIRLQRELDKTKQQARQAQLEAEQSQRRLDAIEESMKTSSAPSVPKLKIYVVRSGDTLRSIARNVLGDSELWIDLYQANHDRLQRGGELVPGQNLVVPGVK